ncbi:uncharacterized protein [Littorina saxatilis]|uniref:uncharacterized protein n=1 Tax=Littorina saxatilis TaxID=31220 RepID=UPI0038B46F9E
MDDVFNTAFNESTRDQMPASTAASPGTPQRHPPSSEPSDGELPVVGGHYLYRWVDNNDYICEVLECETSQVNVRFMRQAEDFIFLDSCPEESWEDVLVFLCNSRKVNIEMDTKRSTNRRQLYSFK